MQTFFSAINLEQAIKIFFFFLCLDITGTGIAQYFKLKSFFRPFNWVFGLGILVFLWFILHFFIKFDYLYILLTLIILAIPFSKNYFVEQKYIDLIKIIIYFPFPILFLYPIYKSLLISLSLPPYIWDEMAYHYISPFQILNETTWNFANPLYSDSLGLYQMLPRFIETAYVIGFGFTGSYMLARFIHLFIFVTAIFSTAIFIKDKVNYIGAVVFVYLAYYLTPSILISATSGYIDSATASIQMLMFVNSVAIVYKPDKSKIYSYFILLALALGSKYTVITFIIANLLLTSAILLFYYYDFVRKELLSKKNLVLILSIVLIFGGFWYIKNVVVSGNPIYPFIFSCFKGLKCGSGQEFFSGWAIPVNLQNYQLIKEALFQKSETLYRLTLAAIIYSIFLYKNLKKKIYFILPMTLVVSVFIEIFFAKIISGFTPRYFYHWYLLIPVSFSLIWQILFEANRKIYTASLIFLLVFAQLLHKDIWSIMEKNIADTNDHKTITPEKRNYARNQMSLDEWTSHLFPKMNEVIKFCQEKGEVKNLLVMDPSLIWSSYEGLSRIYFVNCNIVYVPIDSNNNIEDYKQVVKKYDNITIATQSFCGEEKSYEDKILQAYFDANQDLICNSEKKSNSLYELKISDK